MWRFTRGDSWINRVFPQRVDGPKVQASFPHSILHDIRPVIDYYGWDRFKDIRVASNTSGANLSDLDWLVDAAAAVPANTIRLVTHLSGLSDSSTPRFLQLSVEHGDTANLRVAVSLPLADGNEANQAVCIQRPLILWPGALAHLSSTAAVGAGNTLTVSGMFIDLPLGEVLRA